MVADGVAQENVKAIYIAVSEEVYVINAGQKMLYYISGGMVRVALR
jgi:hypothetical protein